ncbi:MAG: glycosyltransferase [Elainellaceae cyanobacterium]
MKQRKGHIAFIAIGDDSPIELSGQSAANAAEARPVDAGISYSQAAWNLAEQGWHVDVFAHQSKPREVEHPRYREIFLPITLDDQIDRVLESLDAAVQAFMRYQGSQGVLYPIIHTHCWASAWIGARIKQHQLLRLVHTYQGPSCPTNPTHSAGQPAASRAADIERGCLGTIDCLIVTDAALLPTATDVFSSDLTDNLYKLRLIRPTAADLTSAQFVEQLNVVYREQIDLLCHQFFFTSSGPYESQPVRPAAVSQEPTPGPTSR